MLSRGLPPPGCPSRGPAAAWGRASVAPFQVRVYVSFPPPGRRSDLDFQAAISGAFSITGAHWAVWCRGAFGVGWAAWRAAGAGAEDAFGVGKLYSLLEVVAKAVDGAHFVVAPAGVAVFPPAYVEEVEHPCGKLSPQAHHERRPTLDMSDGPLTLQRPTGNRVGNGHQHPGLGRQPGWAASQNGAADRSKNRPTERATDRPTDGCIGEAGRNLRQALAPAKEGGRGRRSK